MHLLYTYTKALSLNQAHLRTINIMSSTTFPAAFNLAASVLPRVDAQSAQPNLVDDPFFNLDQWEVNDLTLEQYIKYTHDLADFDEVICLVSNGWGEPSPDIVRHFEHTVTTIRLLKTNLDLKKQVQRVLFNKIKSCGIETILCDFLNRKKWRPNADFSDPFANVPSPSSSSSLLPLGTP